MTRSSRPAPRESGRAPRRDSSQPPSALDCLESDTLDALRAAVFLQNLQKTPDIGPKSRYLSQCACDIELAILDGKPKSVIDQLCVEAAAVCLRIREQGDGKETP